MHLQAFALGPVLHEWASRFQPTLLDTAASAMDATQSLVNQCASDISTLSTLKGSGILSEAEEQEEMLRLTCLLERQVAVLEKLGNFHQRAVAVSAAALLHAMTRGNLVRESASDSRPANVRRTLSSAASQVTDI